MVRILKNITRACYMLSFFVSLQSMQLSINKPFKKIPLALIVRMFETSEESNYKDYILDDAHKSDCLTIPYNKEAVAHFFLWYDTNTMSDIKKIGTLEDFKETHSQFHEKNRTRLIKKIKSMKNAFTIIDAFSALANFCLIQKCRHTLITPLYDATHTFYANFHKTLSQEKRLQAKILDLHALHNHIIIRIQLNEPDDVKTLQTYVKIFEFLSTWKDYPEKRKAQSDTIILYMYAAEKCEQKKNYTQAYEYYKKASNQTFILQIALEASTKLTYYFEKKLYNTSPTSPFRNADDFGGLFQDQVSYNY